MKSAIIIILTGLLAGCNSFTSVKLDDCQNDIKLAKDIKYPISNLDKYSQIIVLIDNKRIEEITYKYIVERDEPPPVLKAKRNNKNYFILEVIHPSDGISIKAKGFKSKDFVSKGGLSTSLEDIELIPSDFSGILKVKLNPVKR